MISVTVDISAIVMCCDENVANLSLGNGYTIQKVYLKEFEHKEKVCDETGRLFVDYIGSKMLDEDGEIYFMVLHKQEIFEIQGPIIEAGRSYTNIDFECEEELAAYREEEGTFLNNVFSMLRLYQRGNIGTKSIFFDFNYCVPMAKYHLKHIVQNESRNVIDNLTFALELSEVATCSQFVSRVNSTEFALMKNIVNKFVWALNQIDLPTGFEQFTTALEMMLLETDQRNKKECLSKRMAVLIGGTDVKKREIYDTIKDFYRFRSESLHEGDGRNINTNELVILEGYTRTAIVRILDLANSQLETQPSLGWSDIKSLIIDDLKSEVATLISNGVLPS